MTDEEAKVVAHRILTSREDGTWSHCYSSEATRILMQSLLCSPEENARFYRKELTDDVG